MTKYAVLHRRTLDCPSLSGDERGLSTVEYVIILLLISVFAIAAWQSFGQALRGRIKQSHNAISGITREAVAPTQPPAP